VDDNFDAGVTWGWYMWGNPWSGIYGQTVDEILDQLKEFRIRVSSATTAKFANKVEIQVKGWDVGIRSTCESWLLAIDSEIEIVSICGGVAEAQQCIKDSFLAWADDFTSSGLFMFEPLAVIYDYYEPIAKCVQLGPNVLATYCEDENLDTNLEVWAVADTLQDIEDFALRWAKGYDCARVVDHPSLSDLPEERCLVFMDPSSSTAK
jgi:tRNA threonylcarbamoyladenosine modification (KEOPS) complex  Pcc1 subunit